MLTLALALAAVTIPKVAAPPYFDEMPVNAGAIFVYALVIVSVALVLYFGFKKPKGPSGVGHA